MKEGGGKTGQQSMWKRLTRSFNRFYQAQEGIVTLRLSYE